MSEDLDAPVNLKLSDYGISKYCWSGGTVGLVGTPGYQAPEILDGLPYDEKVCHCSVSIHVLIVAGFSLDCALSCATGGLRMPLALFVNPVGPVSTKGIAFALF